MNQATRAHVRARTKRWVALVGGLWILSSGGLSYNFAIYSSQLKENLGLGQRQVDLLGTAKDLGDNVGLIAGFLSAILPVWAMLLVGTFLNLIGYGTLYLVATHRVATPPFWQVFLTFGFGVNSSTFFNTAALVTCVRAFPRSRGVVVGLLKGLVGLSGAIYAVFYTALLSPDQLGFLLVAAVGPSCVALLACLLLKPAPPVDGYKEEEHEEEKRYLTFIFSVFLFLAAYLMADIIISAFAPITKSEYKVVAAGAILIVILPLFVPFTVYSNALKETPPNPLAPDVVSSATAHMHERERRADRRSLSETRDNHSLNAGQLLLEDAESRILRSPDDDDDDDDDIDRPSSPYPTATSAAAGSLESGGAMGAIEAPGRGEGSKKGYIRPRRGENFSLLEGLVKADFWLLFLVMVCGAGSGLTVINNLAQMGEAQGVVDMKVPVALVSIWNFSGRIGGGYFSEQVVRSYGLPRPIVLAGAQVLMGIGHLLFAFALPGSIYVGSLIVGCCFGVHMALLPAIASELFGLQNFGIFYNVFTTAVPIGSYLFSGLLAGYMYDYEAAKGDQGLGATVGMGSGWGGLGLSGNGRGRALSTQSEMATWQVMGAPDGAATAAKCIGAHCFRLTFICMAGVCVVGVLANIVLVVRTRSVYERLYGRGTRVEGTSSEEGRLEAK